VDTQTIVDMLVLLLGGGFDTTSALLAHAINYLSEHRSEHARLLDDDHFMQTAIEEFLRWVCPVVAQARTATRDVELGGQPLRAGDRMLMMFRSANHDPDVFADPETIDLTRWPNPHFAFGSGIHRCLGSNLARSEIEVLLKEVLTTIPDFKVDRAAAKESPHRGSVNGWLSMPITFTPGTRRT
jgi:cytochrome P450